MTIETRERHPLSEIFAESDQINFEDLKKSLAEIGQLDPIFIDEDGRIVDGWRRYQAFVELENEGYDMGEPIYETAHDPYAIVFAKHFARRNLAPGERAEKILQVEEWRLGNDPEAEPKTIRELAEEADTSHETIRRAQQKNEQDEDSAGETGETTTDEDATEEVVEGTESTGSDESTDTGDDVTNVTQPEDRKTRKEQIEDRLYAMEQEISRLVEENTRLQERVAFQEEKPDSKNTKILDSLQSRLQVCGGEKNELRRLNNRLQRRDEEHMKRIQELEELLGAEGN